MLPCLTWWLEATGVIFLNMYHRCFLYYFWSHKKRIRME